ncbi:MAG: peptidylprolyl isomerase, partial [Gemmatimonadales bacterium]
MRGAMQLLVVAAVLGLRPGAAVAQQEADSSNTIDRIVAVVGSRAILASEVLERFQVELGGRTPPTDQKVLKQMQGTILKSLVDEELVVQAAQKDTLIKVTDEEVTRSVDELYRNVRSRLGSDEAFRKQLDETGFQTLEEWRSFTADQQRRRFLRDRFWQLLQQQQKVKDLPPTDAEVRDYFDQNRGSLPPRSEALSFDQVVVTPTPSAAAKAEALRVIDSILVELRNGADFAAAARRYSMDPGSREAGGSLNWIRR